MNGNPFEGDNLVLRALEPADADALQATLNALSAVGRRYLPWGVPDNGPLSRSQVEAALEAWRKDTKLLALAIQSRGSRRLIGHAVCNWHWDPHCPWVSVVVAPEQQRRGFGSEALQLLLSYAFGRTPAHTVHGAVASWNETALAFASANGFTECGRIPRAGLRDGAYYEEILVDLLKREWIERGGGRDAA